MGDGPETAVDTPDDRPDMAGAGGERSVELPGGRARAGVWL